MTTPKAITFIVVGSLSCMSISYVSTLAVCVLSGIQPKSEIMRSFEAAGIYVLGALTGILVNTRSQPEKPNARTDTDTDLHSTDSHTESVTYTATKSDTIPVPKSDAAPDAGTNPTTT
jgi:hypothetical protein